MLVKIFGIGIYNALIGNDRSVDNVCKLLNKPRLKKDAKTYYKIDSDDVLYQSENENDVSEVEIQNILAHYKRLGKNEDRYLESFDNIAAQYNDTQLRIISKFLPLNVRAVLEERSPKYQQIMSFNNKVSDKIRKPKVEEVDGTSEQLLKPKNKENIMSGPVVIPSSVNMHSGKKLSRVKPMSQNTIVQDTKPEQQERITTYSAQKQEMQEYAVMPGLDEQEERAEEPKTVAPVKRGRGRPRKNPVPPVEEEKTEEPPKRRRGRPRKNPVPEENVVTAKTIEEPEETIGSILPGLDNDQEDEKNNYNLYNNIQMPEQNVNEAKDNNDNEIEENILPGIGMASNENMAINTNITTNHYNNNYTNSIYNPMSQIQENNKSIDIEKIDLSELLTSRKKIAAFVGTSKNGTSFIVNNLAEMLSTAGIDIAILDTTKNRNSYYIYTKNEEELRKIAEQSIVGLSKGMASGIEVHKNLTVYTSLPEDNEAIEHADKILETLLKKHTLILIDTDFKTPSRYFEQAQEIYLVQSLDVLTIQPLTAFLRELKSKNILEDRKLRIVLNKAVKIRGITDKTIIGGMAYYNDPAMSFMTELFDRTLIKYISIPFEEETYIKYLENVIECNVSLKGYSKGFLQSLKELGNMIYSVGGTTYRPPTANGYNSQNTFSPGMAQTLNQMKNNY